MSLKYIFFLCIILHGIFLQKLVQRLERTWFGKWCGILNGCVLEEENASELQSHLAELQIKALEIFGELLEVCFY